MKKFKIALLVFLCVLIVAAVALGIWQRENILSFVNSLRYSETQITAKLDDNNKKMEKLVEDTDYIEIRGGLTEEEEKALRNNEISPEEAVKLVRGQTTLEEIKTSQTQAQPTDGQTSPPVQQSPPAEDQKTAEPEKEPSKEEVMKDNVSDIIAQLYVVKSDFVNRLNGIGAQAYEIYKANGSDKSSLTSIAEGFAPEIGALESECDGKVDDLLAQLKTELEKGGGDLSLVTEVKKYYYNEKSLTKSYYLNKYMY